MSLPILVAFDMIGTTIQSSDHVPAAFASAFDKQGIRLSGSDIDAVRGKSKREAIHELLLGHAGVDFAARHSDRVYESFKDTLLDYYKSCDVASIDGAEATFGWCRDNNIQIALTTGFDRELAQLLVTKLAWDTEVDTLVCNDDVSAGRPAPDLILCAMRRLKCADVARVASVGDTVSDLEAGANAGTRWNIGVLSGAHSQQQLESAPHTAILRCVADLPDAL